MRRRRFLAASLLLASVELSAKDKRSSPESLDAYIRRVQQQPVAALEKTTGSLWQDRGRLANMAADYKASQAGDLVTILVVHDVIASNAGNVSADRSLKANSGITAVAGNPSTDAIRDILSLSSASTLAGKAQASTTSSLRTRLTGRVAAVLPDGGLVIEAERQITMNNEHQTVILRGLARAGDVGPDNTILSNALGALELELKGKGVISDGTRRPNPVTRWILRLVGF